MLLKMDITPWMRRLVLAASLLIFCLPSGVGGAAGEGFVIEDFASPDSFYSSWKIKKWKGMVEVTFLRDGAMPFVKLRANKTSWAFIKKLEVDLTKTPVLTWSWRASLLPPGSDGRKDATDDEAAQMYVFFPGKGLFASMDKRIVGYTWEAAPPPGTRYHSPKNDNTRNVVLRNVKDPLNTWIAERRNVAEDFRQLFGTQEVPKPDAICFQIDADDTQSSAESAFADFRFIAK